MHSVRVLVDDSSILIPPLISSYTFFKIKQTTEKNPFQLFVIQQANDPTAANTKKVCVSKNEKEKQ